MPAIRLIVPILFSALLAACGGGGGGGDDEKLGVSATTPHELSEDTSRALGLAINDDGVGVSAFATYSFFESTLYLRQFKSGEGFGAPIPVDIGDGATVREGAGLAVGASGRGLIAWKRFKFQDDDAIARTFDAQTGALGTLHVLDDSTADSFEPVVAVDALGRAVVAWRQRETDGDIQLYGATYVPGDGWGSSTLLEPSVNTPGGPHISIGPTGDAIVAWSLQVGDDSAVRARAVSGGEWSGVHTVSFVSGRTKYLEDAVVADNGEATVLYSDAATTSRTVRSLHAKRHRPATLVDPGWQAIETIEPTPGTQLRVGTALLDGTDILAIYALDLVPDTTAALRFARYSPGVGWSAPAPLGTLTHISFNDMGLRIVARGRHVLVDYDHWTGAAAERRATLLRDGVPVYTDRRVPLGFPRNAGPALDGNGHAVIASPSGQPLFGLVAVRLYANADVEGPVTLDSGAEGRVESHFVALDAQGRGAVLWERGDPDDPQGHSDVFHIELR